MDNKTKSGNYSDEILIVPHPTVEFWYFYPGIKSTPNFSPFTVLNPITKREVRFTEGKIRYKSDKSKEIDLSGVNSLLHNNIRNERLKTIIYIADIWYGDSEFYQDVGKTFREINPRLSVIFSKISNMGGDLIGRDFLHWAYTAHVCDLSHHYDLSDKSTYEHFFPPKYDGFIGVDKPFLCLDDSRAPFMNFLVSDAKPKLYLLVAPTGFGKSTLINEMKYLCVKLMPKITTRPYRNLDEISNPSIESISIKDFVDQNKAGAIVGARFYNDNLYGLRKDKILDVPASYRNHMVDSCDVESALRLREQFPDLVKLVTLFPSVSLAGFGLERRLRELSRPSEGFESFQEQLEYLKKNNIAIKDTKHRLEGVVQESRKFQKYMPYFDIVLKGYDMQSNMNALLIEMAK
jgi:guanylate kinase